MCTKGVLTFCFTGDMIKMAKVEGSRNAPFLCAKRRCLSNPFTPPVLHRREEWQMPRKPKKPCRHPGCPKLTDGLYCEEHEALHRGDRASSSKRGYNRRWQKARAVYLKAHPFCVACMKERCLQHTEILNIPETKNLILRMPFGIMTLQRLRRP